MSKKRVAAARGRKGDSPARAAAPKRPAQGVATPGTYAVVGVAAFIAFCALFGWTAGASLVVAPLLTGAFVAVCLEKPLASALVAGTAGLLAAATSATVYALPGLYERANAAPPNTNMDIPGMLYDIVANLMARNPLNSMTPPMGTLLLLLCGSVGAGAVAWGVATLLRSLKGDTVRLRRGVAAGIVAILCVSYAYTAISASGDMIGYADQEPAAGTYAFDATTYLKTYYNMLDGADYYEALVDAAAGDARVMKDTATGTGVRGGKSYGGWLWGPAAMRRPTIFYIWRYVAPGGGGDIIVLAVFASALTLATLAWGLAPYLAHRAAFVPIFAMPYVLFMTMGLNVFFPDYWGALLTVAALAVIMRRRWFGGAALLLASAAVRETAGPGIVIVAATLVVVWLRYGRGRVWLARAVAFWVAAAAWLGFEKIHEAIGAPYMAVEYASTLQVLTQTALTRSFDQKVLRPTTYLVPGGFFRLRGVMLMLLAPIGFRAVLASQKEVRLVVVTYTLFWAAFVFVVGATSEYWGQAIILPSLVGIGCLFVVADRLDRRGEMVAPVPWE